MTTEVGVGDTAGDADSTAAGMEVDGEDVAGVDRAGDTVPAADADGGGVGVGDADPTGAVAAPPDVTVDGVAAGVKVPGWLAAEDAGVPEAAVVWAQPARASTTDTAPATAAGVR